MILTHEHTVMTLSRYMVIIYIRRAVVNHNNKLRRVSKTRVKWCNCLVGAHLQTCLIDN